MTNDQYTVIKSREAKERRQQMEAGRMQTGVVSVHASELRALREANAALILALQGIFAQTAKHSRQWGQEAGAHAFARDPETAKAFAFARAALAKSGIKV